MAVRTASAAGLESGQTFAPADSDLYVAVLCLEQYALHSKSGMTPHEPWRNQMSLHMPKAS